MNDTSAFTSRIAFISALFGILALIVAFWGMSFGFLGAFVIGLIVAAVVWAILRMGWRAPQETASSAPATQSDVATKPDTTPTPAVATPAAAPASARPSAVIAAPAAPVVKPAVVKDNAVPDADKAQAKPVVDEASDKPAVTKPAIAKSTPAAAKPKKAASEKPAVLDTARAGGADDLKMIKGVGPVLEKALHTAGVFHFDQVGAWTKKDARWFDENVKGANGRVMRDEWVKQARILAKGGTTEFASKVKKGGVY